VEGSNKGFSVVPPFTKRRILRDFGSALRVMSGAEGSPQADQIDEFDMMDVGRDEGAECIEDSSDARREASEIERSQPSWISSFSSRNDLRTSRLALDGRSGLHSCLLPPGDDIVESTGRKFGASIHLDLVGVWVSIPRPRIPGALKVGRMREVGLPVRFVLSARMVGDAAETLERVGD
jgi:hypothetical protein